MMFSIYPKSFSCIARNWQMFLVAAIGYFAITLLPGGQSGSLVANTVITTFLTTSLLRYFLLDLPTMQGFERGLFFRTFGAMLLTGGLPLVFLVIAIAIVAVKGGQAGGGAIALLVLAFLAMPLWIAMTAMALPAAVLKRPIMAHAFRDIRKTMLPTLGGLLIGPFAVLVVLVLLLGGVVAALYRTGDMGALGLGGPKIWLLSVVSISLQLLGYTLTMAVYAHVWQTRVELPTQAEVFA